MTSDGNNCSFYDYESNDDGSNYYWYYYEYYYGNRCSNDTDPFTNYYAKDVCVECGDDVVETIFGGKEGTGVRNKLGRSVGKTVVLLDA